MFGTKVSDSKEFCTMSIESLKGKEMKIVSDDSRILDEIFDHLDMEGIEVEKIEIEDNNISDERAMGGIETVLSMGANAISIFTTLQKTISYINQNYPEWDIIFKPFVSNKYKITLEEYESMSDHKKKALHENFDMVIKRK